MVKKVEKKKTHGGAPKFETSQDAIDHLIAKGYNHYGVWRYAKAAKSWESRGSKEWDVWQQVEDLMAPKEEE